LDWLKTIDDNFRAQPKHYGNIFLNLRGMINLLPKLKLDTKLLLSHNLLQKPLQTTFSIFNSPTSVNTLNNSNFTHSDFLNIQYIYSDVKQAISRFHSTKCIGLYEIPKFILKGWSEIFMPLLHHILNLSILSGKIPSLWKQAAVILIFRKGSGALVVNYIPILVLNNFSKIFASIIHDHLFFNFKSKLHPNQHCFVKPKSMVTNSVNYLNDVLLSVSSQGQFDSVYFDLHQAFDKVSHNNFELSSI
jgi:hypothetical protein